MSVGGIAEALAAVLPKVERYKARILSPDEIARLSACTPERYRMLVRLLSYSGLRVGEALALRVGDVDLMRRRITVSRALKEIDGTLSEGATKTQDSERVIVLPSLIRDELVTYLKKFSDPSDTRALVFSDTDGGYVRASNFRSRVFYPACEAAGIAVPKFDEHGKRTGWQTRPPRVHDLRHSAATIMFATGASLREVQDALGHTDPRLTLSIYAGVLSEMAERTADRMDEMIASSDAGEAKVIALPR